MELAVVFCWLDSVGLAVPLCWRLQSQGFVPLCHYMTSMQQGFGLYTVTAVPDLIYDSVLFVELLFIKTYEMLY